MADLKKTLFHYGEKEGNCEVTKETKVIPKDSSSVYQNFNRKIEIGNVSSIKNEQDGIVIYFQLKEEFRDKEFSDKVDFANDPELLECKNGEIKKIHIIDFSLEPIT